MGKERKRRRRRTSGGYIRYYVYEKERIRFVKKGHVFKRKYLVAMHLNRNTDKFCAGFGYWDRGHMKYLWLKTANRFGVTRLKEELMHRYHNHIEILLGQLELVKVKKSILETSVPALPDGRGLPVEEGYDVFKKVKRLKGEFNLLIEGIDGRRFKVDGACFVRTRPMNWIEDIYKDF